MAKSLFQRILGHLKDYSADKMIAEEFSAQLEADIDAFENTIDLSNGSVLTTLIRRDPEIARAILQEVDSLREQEALEYDRIVKAGMEALAWGARCQE